MSAFSISTIAQYNADVDKAKLATVDLKDILIDDDSNRNTSSREDRQAIPIHDMV